MTATNNWSGKPGVPLNPERDGWHWVKIIHGISQPRPRLWWSKIDRWELSDGALISPSEFAERWRYLGPVLTPDEAAALQKRCEEAERERDALRRDTSQEIATDEMVRRLQHLGDWQAADRIEALQKRVAELEDFCEDYLVRFELFHVTNTKEAPEDATGFLAEKARAALEGGKDE